MIQGGIDMKKKYLAIILTVLLAILLVACGSDNSDVEEPVEEEQEVTKQEEVGEEEEPIETESEKNSYFDGEVAEIEDVNIKIIDTKVIKVGEEGNESGEKPVFAIWYEVTNKSDKEIDPSTSWILMFQAVQDNDDNMVNTLDVGMLPDKAHLDTQLNIIKQDGTLENSIAYELDDEVTPVTLIAKKDLVGDEIGRHDYKID